MGPRGTNLEEGAHIKALHIEPRLIHLEAISRQNLKEITCRHEKPSEGDVRFS